MSSSLIAELKQRVSIGQVAGTSMKRGACPFCGSATGLKINHLTNGWRCYSCERGGSQIDWIVHQNGCSDREAVHQLADMAGMTLKPNQERVEILRAAASVFREALPKHRHALKAMEKRGFTRPFLFSRNVGYCNGEIMAEVIDKVGFEPLVDMRLIYQTGDPYYRDHIVIPIRTPRGEINNLQGRALYDTDLKYLALPKETRFGSYSIQSHLYNEESLRAYAQDPKSYVFLCEGVPDTWTLLQAGLNAVGLLGNSTIKFHTRKLEKIKTIFVILDNDARTGEKLLDQLLHLQIGCPQTRLRVIRLPQGVDPATGDALKVDVNDWFVKHGGTVEQLRQFCEAAPLGMELLLKEWGLDESKHEYLFAAIGPMGARDQERWLKQMALTTGIGMDSLIYAARVMADLQVKFKRGRG